MPLTVHHLHYAQSERVPWLCEELGVPYELKTYTRAPILAPEELKKVHPAGSAPVIEDGSVMLAESGACMEYISHKHANGKLFLPPSHPDYAEFLYWWHWANGTLQAHMSRLMTLTAGGLGEDNQMRKTASGRMERSLVMMDKRLEANDWLAGKEFTAADIMSVFSMTTMRYFYPLDLSDYKGILGWLQRVNGREAYTRTMKSIDPEMELALGGKSPRKNFFSKM
ncbi:MAG: hypothetical protein MMC23_009256 [Stictis urceolatum]|nr:hypothetical protein [Stictis urceolata]